MELAVRKLITDSEQENGGLKLEKLISCINGFRDDFRASFNARGTMTAFMTAGYITKSTGFSSNDPTNHDRISVPSANAFITELNKLLRQDGQA